MGPGMGSRPAEWTWGGITSSTLHIDLREGTPAPTALVVGGGRWPLAPGWLPTPAGQSGFILLEYAIEIQTPAPAECLN